MKFHKNQHLQLYEVKSLSTQAQSSLCACTPDEAVHRQPSTS